MELITMERKMIHWWYLKFENTIHKIEKKINDNIENINIRWNQFLRSIF